MLVRLLETARQVSVSTVEQCLFRRLLLQLHRYLRSAVQERKRRSDGRGSDGHAYALGRSWRADRSKISEMPARSQCEAMRGGRGLRLKLGPAPV